MKHSYSSLMMFSTYSSFVQIARNSSASVIEGGHTIMVPILQ
jgi:hypothetical protein